jgi:hypothetical protein
VIGRSASITLFTIVLSLVIFVESSFAIIGAIRSTTESHLNQFLPWFAGVEALAAAMLLWPRTVRVAGWLLLLVFAMALIIHGPANQLEIFVYAAGVIVAMSRSNNK